VLGAARLLLHRAQSLRVYPKRFRRPHSCNHQVLRFLTHVRHTRRCVPHPCDALIFPPISLLLQKVAEARNKRELDQLRSVSSKSHKQRLEVSHSFSFCATFCSKPLSHSPHVRNSTLSCLRFPKLMRFPTLRAVDSTTIATIICNSLLNKKRLLQFLLILSLKIRCSLVYFHLTNSLRAHAFVRKKRPPDYWNISARSVSNVSHVSLIESSFGSCIRSVKQFATIAAV